MARGGAGDAAGLHCHAADAARRRGGCSVGRCAVAPGRDGARHCAAVASQQLTCTQLLVLQRQPATLRLIVSRPSAQQSLPTFTSVCLPTRRHVGGHQVPSPPRTWCSTLQLSTTNLNTPLLTRCARCTSHTPCVCRLNCPSDCTGRQCVPSPPGARLPHALAGPRRRAEAGAAVAAQEQHLVARAVSGESRAAATRCRRGRVSVARSTGVLRCPGLQKSCSVGS